MESVIKSNVTLSRPIFNNKNMFKWEKILAAIKQQMLSVLLELFKNASVL